MGICSAQEPFSFSWKLSDFQEPRVHSVVVPSLPPLVSVDYLPRNLKMDEKTTVTVTVAGQYNLLG